MLATEQIVFNPAEIVDPRRVLDPVYMLDPGAHAGDLFVYLFNVWWRRARNVLPWISDMISPIIWSRD